MQLNIHEIDKSIDNVFRRTGDPKVQFLQAITVGQNTDMPQYKIYVRAEREWGHSRAVSSRTHGGKLQGYPLTWDGEGDRVQMQVKACVPCTVAGRQSAV